MIRTLLTTTAFVFAATAATAGGYVAAIPSVAPTLSAPAADNRVLIGVGILALLAALFSGGKGGGDHFSTTPIDQGGPCFMEGTLIMVGPNDFRPVETIAVNDTILTSKGPQKVLSVESWQPVSIKDSPAIYKGVRMSPNHRIVVNPTIEDVLVPVGEVSEMRGWINGRRYYHILVTDHALVVARASTEAEDSVLAETLAITDDMRSLATRFPHLVAHHAEHPAVPVQQVEMAQ